MKECRQSPRYSSGDVTEAAAAGVWSDRQVCLRNNRQTRAYCRATPARRTESTAPLLCAVMLFINLYHSMIRRATSHVPSSVT